MDVSESFEPDPDNPTSMHLKRGTGGSYGSECPVAQPPAALCQQVLVFALCLKGCGSVTPSVHQHACQSVMWRPFNRPSARLSLVNPPVESEHHLETAFLTIAACP